MALMFRSDSQRHIRQSVSTLQATVAQLCTQVAAGAARGEPELQEAHRSCGAGHHLEGARRQGQ
eukprot:5564422-Pyramimonas_sp.AAC.1